MPCIEQIIALETAQACNFPTNKKASFDVYLGKQFPFSAIEDNIFLGRVLKNGAVCDGKPRAMALREAADVSINFSS